jgi:hypothetical protein
MFLILFDEDFIDNSSLAGQIELYIKFITLMLQVSSANDQNAYIPFEL